MGFIKRNLPVFLYDFLYDFYEDYIGVSQKSYSNEGEDIILQKIFSKKQNKGFYIDVGCYHPKTYSNTYFFYKKGWQGMNIDANPLCIKKFKQFRKKDINLNFGVGKEKESLTFYLCNVPACNTFSKEIVDEKVKNNDIKLISTLQVEIVPLAKILDEYLPENQQIDIMDIDVEGFDLAVLQSNNWEKYRPKILLAEDFNRNFMANPESSAIYQFLISQNYELISKTFNTLFFQDKNQNNLK